MKKITILLGLVLFFSCEKEEVQTDGTVTSEPITTECHCGVISSINHINENNQWTTKTVIYNQCSANDTTINYVPQTTSGIDKEVDDPHCLGVSW